MASQYKRVKLSQTGLVSATRIAAVHGDDGGDLRDEEDDDDELQLASASKQPAGRPGGVLDDEDSDEGAPDPAQKQKQQPKKQPMLSAGASTSKGKRRSSKKQHSDGEYDVESDDAMDSADGMSEEGGVPDDFDPDVVSVSDDDEDLSLSEDDEGNVVSKKPVAKRGTTATRARAQASSQAKAAKPAASKKAKTATAAKKVSQKPAARRTRARPQALPNLIRKHDLQVFEDSSDEEADNSTSYSRAVDFRHLTLKQDHGHRPLWVTPDYRIFLETFSPVYKPAYDFLIAIAEPVSRPETIHEYQLTMHSLYAAVSVGLPTETIISVLEKLSKNALDADLKSFIRNSTRNFGKVKLVLQRNRLFVESPEKNILEKLLEDIDIKAAHEACGNAGIKSGQGRLDTAAAAIATTMQTIDLTKVPQEDHDDDGDGDQPGTSGGKQRGGDVEDEEAEEAERSFRAGGATNTGAKKTLACASARAAGAGAQTNAGKGNSNSAAAQGAHPGGRGSKEGGEQCAPQPVPHSKQSAVPEEAANVELFSFEISPLHAEKVKKRCLPANLNYPMLEEYDFRNDSANPDIPYELKSIVKHRPYQEKGLAKMFGNGRARSGIIVLPCGAGKSLTGISAAVRCRKSVLVLVTNAVSVDQWVYQFKLWTTIQDENIGRFTSSNKNWFTADAGVMVCTYSMIAGTFKRAADSQKVFDAIVGREWGLILLDEVHVVPAEMFRKVVGIIKSHCKLGLTATLVREDDRIADLNFLIGPKLYEANWLDLTRAGHIANVSCAEVWCNMDADFYRTYLREPAPNRRISLSVLNPEKFRACQFLIRFHEVDRKDKIIVFSDNIFALKEYAMRLKKPFIYGATSHAERTKVLSCFKHSTHINTIFLSKVGDNSLDIPEANVLIQISSHAGSRRQEAQRLGRILRAKRGTAVGEYNAFFYTLVSKDTQEMFFSAKRQRFLIDQGYSFKVVTDLLATNAAKATNLLLSTHQERLDLLAKLRSADAREEGLEQDANDDGIPGVKVKRRKRAMADMTGADASYREFNTANKKKTGDTLRKIVNNRRRA